LYVHYNIQTETEQVFVVGPSRPKSLFTIMIYRLDLHLRVPTI